MLRKNKARTAGAGIIIILALFANGCFLSSGHKTKIRTMLEDSDSIANLCKTTLTTTETLRVTENLGNPIVNTILDTVEQINSGNRALNAGLRDILTSGTTNAVQVTDLMAKLDLIDRQLDIFNGGFIQHQANAKVKTILLSFYTAAKAAITSIRITYMAIQAGGR